MGVRKSAICSGAPRKGVLAGWRQRSEREKDRLRKAKEKKRRIRPHGGDAPDCKSAPSSAIMRSHKPLQKQRKDAVRKYSIHKVPGTLQGIPAVRTMSNGLFILYIALKHLFKLCACVTRHTMPAPRMRGNRIVSVRRQPPPPCRAA